ncbi:MAG: hypothetical protein IJP51_02330 [Acidaminococcaceae bacterium]|nr:hypothetical protein [Acidaminococcaceae bacterium]
MQKTWKAMMAVWVYGWAYLFVILMLLDRLLDRLGDWMEYQIDHNDYLAGAIGALMLMAIPYIIGVIDIVVRG